MSDHYIARLMAAQAVALFKPGSIFSVTVEHEAGCQYERIGACTCDPDISAVDATTGEVFVIGPNGEVVDHGKSQ